MDLYRISASVEMVIHGKDAEEALTIAESIAAVDGASVQIERLRLIQKAEDLPEGVGVDSYAMSAWEYKDIPQGKQPIKFWLTPEPDPELISAAMPTWECQGC